MIPQHGGNWKFGYVGGGGGRVVRSPGNSRGEGGGRIKITFQGVNFELSTKIATCRSGRSFLKK